MVPTMDCTEEDYTYMDYKPKPRKEPARRTECEVKKEQVCVPITTNKCDTIKYKVCKQEKVEDDCEDYKIIVPYKKKLHLKWCLLDDGVTDFTKEVTEAEGGGPPDDPAEDPAEDSTDQLTDDDSGKSDDLQRSGQFKDKDDTGPLQKFPFGLNLRKKIEDGRQRRASGQVKSTSILLPLVESK